MKWFKKKPKRWSVKLSAFGPVNFNIDNGEFELDLTHPATIHIMSKVIDCDNGGTCETSTDGGFRIEVTPVDL